MATLTEPRFPGEFIATEANGKRSRDNDTIAAGTITTVGRVLSGPSTARVLCDGSAAATAVSFNAVDATAAAKTGVTMTSSCELNRAEMDFGAMNNTQIGVAIADLKLIGVIARPAV